MNVSYDNKHDAGNILQFSRLPDIALHTLKENSVE